MKRKTIISIVLIFLSAGIFFSGCSQIKEKYQDLIKKRDDAALSKTEEEESVFAVNVTRSIEGQINDYIELNGDVVTKANVDVYADTVGKITALYIDVGSVVAKDEVIAEVDPSRPGMRFVASPVKSPISGTIVDIPVREGATITQATPVATVSRTRELEIRTHVAERFISKMRLGLNAIIRFEAFPDERFQARISEISPVVDPQSRTLELKLRLLSPDRRIKSGMFAEIKIITEKKDNIVKIPYPALIKRYGEYFVFVVHDQSYVEKRKVNPGIQIDSKVEITEGLEPDEMIVIRGQTLLEDNAKVKVIDTVQPLEAQDKVE